MIKTGIVVAAKLLERIVYFLAGWLVLIPLTYLIPKDNKLILFKGTSNNVKYLFFHACRQPAADGAKLYFMTRNKHLSGQFKKYGLPVLEYPSLHSFWKMFRAGTYIVDNHISPLNYYIFYRSRKVQLWHGIVVKKVGPSSIKGLKKLPPSWLKTLGMKLVFYPTYDAFISNSEFCTKEIFGPTMKARRFLDYGYPRNDVLFSKPSVAEPLWGTDEISNRRIESFKAQGGQVVLVSPTWRDTGGELVSDQAVDLASLNAFGAANNILFVFKFHPSTRTRAAITDYSHCMEYIKGRDIYPVMSLIDLMVTDYSSIYLDYLLLKKPLVFFPYDYQKYTEKDRDLIVDYEWFTPGPKCYTQPELEAAIARLLVEKQDDYTARRQEILDVACTYQDGKAAERVWNFIKEQARLDSPRPVAAGRLTVRGREEHA